MTIFNIIVILSISDKELFHFGTFRPSKKNKKIDFNWVTITYEDKNPTNFRNNYCEILEVVGIKCEEVKAKYQEKH